MDSSTVTERRVVVCGGCWRCWPTTTDDGVKGNLDDDNVGDVKVCGLGNDMRALHLVIHMVVVDRKAKRNNVPSRAAVMFACDMLYVSTIVRRVKRE